MSIRRAVAAGVSSAILVAACLITALPARADDLPISFPVSGSGFGHGVGLSQWGAYGMAKAGWDATGIVTHYFTGTTVTPVQDDMEARINLLYHVGSAKMRSEVLDAGGGSIEVTVGATVVLGTTADEFRFSTDGANVLVRKASGGQTVDVGAAPAVYVHWAGTRVPNSAVGPATLVNVAGPSTSLDSSGHRYRYGSIEVLPISTTAGVKLNVVNLVRVHDEYLYGISEVSSSWPDAAQQAQVMAARTYAMSKVNRGVRQVCGCHMDDGGGPYYDQTFTGVSKMNAAMGDRWVANVNATAASPSTGLAILYDGLPISAFYSASSGGYTQSVQDAWGGTLPYAVSVPDPWMAVPENPNAAWNVDVGQARMASLFGLPTVAKVEVSERYSSGAAKTVTATAIDGTVASKSGAGFASGLGLKSKFVTAISGNVGAPLPPAVPATGPAAPPPTIAPDPTAPAPPVVPAPQSPAPPPVKQRTVSLLSPTAITPAASGKYKVVGVVRPAKPGLRVLRQELVKGEWKKRERTSTNAKGRYRFSVKSPSAGTYRVLVVKKGNVVGVSPEFTVA